VLRAVDVATGKVAWEHRQSGATHTWGGTLSTASGVVFYCDDSGDFNAIAANGGNLLWMIPGNARWKTSPMTYSMDGRQFVAVTAGANIVAFSVGVRGLVFVPVFILPASHPPAPSPERDWRLHTPRWPPAGRPRSCPPRVRG